MIKIFATTLTLLLFVSSCGTTQKVGKSNSSKTSIKRSIASDNPWSPNGVLVTVNNPQVTDSSPINLRTPEGRVSGKTLSPGSNVIIDVNQKRQIGNQVYFIYKGSPVEGDGTYEFTEDTEGLLIHKSRVFITSLAAISYFPGGHPVFQNAADTKSFAEVEALLKHTTLAPRFNDSEESYELLDVSNGSLQLRGLTSNVQGWMRAEFICQNTFTTCP